MLKPGGSQLIQFSDLDTFKANIVAVILKKDMTFFRFTEVFKAFVFADRDQIAELLRAAYIFHYLSAVQPMLPGIVRQYGQAGLVPLARCFFQEPSRIGFYKIVTRSQSEIPIWSHFDDWLPF